MSDADISALIADLRSEGVDVIRVSFPDMIGVDRGRDVLIDELGTALGHGLAFCRAAFHTTPMGDVVPVQGGIEQGCPTSRPCPDLSTLTACRGSPESAGAWRHLRARGRASGRKPEAPRASGRRELAELGLHAVVGPELEFYLLEPDDSAPSAGTDTPTRQATSTSWAARATPTASC